MQSLNERSVTVGHRGLPTVVERSTTGIEYSIAFVVEQVLGHRTHGANLRKNVLGAEDIEAHWIYPPYDTSGRRIPLYDSNWTIRVGFRSRRMLRDVRRSHDLDAVFFHTQVPALLCHDYVRKLPTVISLDATPRQIDRLGAAYGHARGRDTVERLKWRAACASFRAAEHLVTWSEWAKQGLVDEYGVPPHKVTVIPPGVSVREWARPEHQRNETAPTRILFVGGDLERKGGRLLLQAFSSLRELNAELHVVTQDPVQPAPGVFVHNGLTPNSPELRALYHQCDVFALPTLGDCLPMALSEAGAAGLPSVSTNVAAIPEVVLDQRTGILVPPGDLDSLHRALRRLIEHPIERATMGTSATAHIAAHFDNANNTARLLDVMRHVVDRRRSVDKL